MSFEEIFRTQHAFVWRTLRRMGVGECDINDASQKVFLIAFRRLSEFEARSSIKTVAPTEKFVLNLGVDDAISVKRKLVNRLREDTGVLSRRVRTTYDVLITVQNNRTTAEKLVVKDQLPISKDEKIVVTLIAPPARDITQDEDGTIRWSLDLKPGEKRELPLKISIEHPADLSVAGLE